MPSRELANLIAKNFISRQDVKAIQKPEGHYVVHAAHDRMGNETKRYPWDRQALEDHLAGTHTYGHYLLGRNDQVKFFAFDIDLEKKGSYPIQTETEGWTGPGTDFNPREAWLNRRHPSRDWTKYQLKMTAHSLMAVISRDLELPCVAAYSGGKGVHVYALTGPIDAAEAREGARIVMDTLGTWEPSRGENFFKHKDQDFLTGYPNLSIEVFPKQDSLEGKDLGNLMRCPLGRNLKSRDKTFFIDMTSPMGQMVPLDAVYALTTGAEQPWSTR